ncbi:cellulose biosynthesis protein BcsQ [Oceanisphaera arctica]|uniref:Cellulose synthase operon protein YhjQ n=1 Tax=Oceanisphaera arctica TaxID=641510 RepID=A0A2P5TPJ4_9GAMM|nr:cellulose biosynthesis protein BcsQ [Oceanisphaera arctica]PPL17601.1 cellulose synthase operon protein YhjQ [Oceanisphaera arctica]GHA15985.1 cell division protein [Oceanisphaera arctica]
MPVIALQGIRGGVGTTSVTAGLAWALRRLGERVLVIDFSPDNQLCLHFNAPLSLTAGWARAELDASPWHQEALRYEEGLDLLPFGHLSVAEHPRWLAQHRQEPGRWMQYLTQLRDSGDYDWLLLDLPAADSACAERWRAAADAVFCVLTADANSHIRLHRQQMPPGSRLLLNQFSADSRLQQDLQQYWRQHLDALLPLSIHRDEAMAEALAAKQPVGEYSAISLAADELNVLAGWCLAHVSGARP